MQPAVTPSTNPRQRSPVASYLYRNVPQFLSPEWANANAWRGAVRNQPVATICRETIIANFLALDWAIEPVESNQRDELKPTIQYYTRLFETHNGMSYENHVEWIGQDLLDIPFGGASEVGRQGDKASGKVMWYVPLDGATLYPTLNYDTPVMQRVDSVTLEPVLFPYYAINRVYMSPRPEFERQGWGMPPPQKIYLALAMLNRGDQYYANLLLDTPEAGILDLGDMERESAEQWVESFRSLLGGIDPWKIPVLYEHTTDIKWLPFNRPPTDLMFDRISLQKAALIASGYGLTLSDIGIPQGTGGGDTLAGSIRSERRSRKTGFAVFKKKMVSYFNAFLPASLRFRCVDYDDELNVAMGRARLASSTAFSSMIKNRYITPKEARLQTIADGMMSIPMPEDVPVEEFDVLTETAGGDNAPERPGMLGNPVSPSQGGYGESAAGMGGVQTRAKTTSVFDAILRKNLKKTVESATERNIAPLVKKIAPKLFYQTKSALEDLIDPSQIVLWSDWHEKALSGEVETDDMVSRAMTDIQETAEEAVEEEDWWTIDLDMKEVLAILSAAYILSVKSATLDLIQDLYRSGYLPSAQVEAQWNLTNEQILDTIRKAASNIPINVNQGTKYYLRRILVSVVRDAMTSEAIAAKILEGIDIQDLLDDTQFMQDVLRQVRSELADLVEYRVPVISDYELTGIQRRAKLDAYRRSGLKLKRWEHIGTDEPCETCQVNIAAGAVPLDFKYESVFGPTEFPPAHPHEHCDLMYDQGDLYTALLSGNFTIWTGD